MHAAVSNRLIILLEWKSFLKVVHLLNNVRAFSSFLAIMRSQSQLLTYKKVQFTKIVT
jgi:hypothetical protein